MRTPRLTMRGLMAVVAVIGGCLTLARIQPALVGWLVLLIVPVASWTALRLERPGHAAPATGWNERLAVFLEALFWCVSVVVTLLVALTLVSPWVESLN